VAVKNSLFYRNRLIHIKEQLNLTSLLIYNMGRFVQPLGGKCIWYLSMSANQWRIVFETKKTFISFVGTKIESQKPFWSGCPLHPKRNVSGLQRYGEINIFACKIDIFNADADLPWDCARAIFQLDKIAHIKRCEM